MIGDKDCERFNLRKFAEKEIEPLKSIEAVPESEHIDESLQDADEVDPERLMEGKFIHSYISVSKKVTQKEKVTNGSHIYIG